MPRLILSRNTDEEVRITLPSGQLVRVRLQFDAAAEIRVDREEIALLRDQPAVAQPQPAAPPPEVPRAE